MSLADFIEADRQGLIDDWTEYALALSQEDSHLTETQLRDSAADILAAIAADMREAQDPAQQETKSRGDKRAPHSAFNRVAHLHAEDRVSHGFSINDVVAEFRALRATVLRRWQATSPDGAAAFEEMIRFNEAIDQVLAESVRHYAYRTERIRDLFAGVLAHDLRSPLGAILNAGEVLLHDEGLSPASVRAVAFVQRGAMRMKQMIDDLLIFTRNRLGDALPVSFTPQDFGRICRDAIDEVRASYPKAHIELQLAGDLRGRWDGSRLGQLVVNLLSNAVRYGTGPVVVEAGAHDGQVTLVVSNEGNPIPEQALPTLFDPLTRAGPADRSGTAAGIGLGLYICRCVANAHQGAIGATSSSSGTRFTVCLPCSPASGEPPTPTRTGG
ncbi:HAMP domain-containing histidine kinase [Paraburkholderia sp. UYCP14C]|uniref:sensor histidine kinase n=1 Tax=Paraburkholderia sp. UYCP14C TaxID=2511130 RepID=UPI0010228C12|nr:HAMP domain-containing sensor histidine kinase [Paraburkholderia sp. UYCP14C]RZF26623.1 HAMP domain-containing histidine kinase [Paraburkholderia sp. UYCP14C]